MGATLTDLKASHATLRERLAGRLEGREENHATSQKTGGTEPQSHRSRSGQMKYTLLFLLTVLSVKYMSVQVAGLVLLALAFLYYLLAMKPSDPYGTFHEDLNRVGGNTGERPSTEWLNMGYWEDTNEFPKACEALALKLVHLANCQEGGSVLDVGHGSGDSLLLHLQHPTVPRPSQLTGITSLLEHHKRASERVDKAIKANEQSGKHSPLVVLRQGDAVHRPSAGAQHPLAPTNSESYTSILALDCAYHFRTRETFLEQSFAHLAHGGTIALADICFAREGHPLLRYIVSALGVLPRENMISPQEYIASMTKIGYTEISLEDITDSVLPGFQRFLSSRGIVWFLFSMSMGLVQGAGARFVLVKGRRP
ncbi:hypothetical protein K474DRAFT_1659876 [Panus rudis PR-1116 ss-1]|nr:hypothetical protein K474DRAFT_1659876 [Panus rudis PR-1116 ss-1]